MNTKALRIWKHFHWLFFTNTQALVVCFGRLKNALRDQCEEGMRAELKTAVELLRASGASMRMAGSFSRQEYESIVRPSMQAPNIQEDDFSGLMSWDHAVLVQLWRELSPLLGALPETLHPEHQELLKAYRFLATSHREVCERFGGSEGGSIRSKKSVAVNLLDQFQKNRSKLLAPRKISGCPVFHD